MSAYLRPPGVSFAMRFFIGTELGPSESYTYDEIVTAARHVAWHYSLGDPALFYPPDDMLQDVLRAMARADHDHMPRLARAYPLYAALVRIVKDDDVMGLAMIMNLLEYKITNEIFGFKPATPAELAESAVTTTPIPLVEPPLPAPPLCAHGVTEPGACTSADCPNEQALS